MSSRSRKLAKYEMRDGGRLYFLIALLDLDVLKNLGLVDRDATEKPKTRAILDRLDVRADVFTKSDVRLRGKPIAGTGVRTKQRETVTPVVRGVVVDELAGISVERWQALRDQLGE